MRALDASSNRVAGRSRFALIGVRRPRSALSIALVAGLAFSCSESDSGTPVATGGTVSTGGVPATGGVAPTTGGAPTGGTPTGGAPTGGVASGGIAGGGAGGASAGGGAAGGGAAGAAGGGAGGAIAGGGSGGAMAGGGSGGGGAGGAPDGRDPLLSQTGLFKSVDPSGELVLEDGVTAFEPAYALWSDDLDKRRWVYLPPGTTIDTTKADHWEMPEGTKLWKEFALDGQRIETRLIERTGPGPDDWVFSAYQWETIDSTDAELVNPEDLILDASGTFHDIPSVLQCGRCHRALPERVLGFSALQLAHDGPGVTLTTLAADNRFSTPLPPDIGFPGDDTTRDALGYLHANCGNCHNDTPGVAVEAVPEPQLYFRVLVGNTTPEETGTYQTAVNHPVTGGNELGIPLRIAGGNAAMSAARHRMSLRSSEDQMPPIASEVRDDAGLAVIDAWIATLPAP